MTAQEIGCSQIVDLLRLHGEQTRNELATRCGLSRSAVNGRLDTLIKTGLITESTGSAQTKGRPADHFRFNPDRGRVLCADVGVTQASVGICDLGSTIISRTVLDIDTTRDPHIIMEELADKFDELLAAEGMTADEISGIGIGIPAPVKAGAGFSVKPPIMPAWNGFDVPAWLSSRYSAPVVLEKDANVMAYGETRVNFPEASHLMLVKIGTGIGSGSVIGGRLFRGTDGAAGDLGHIHLDTLTTEESGPLCKCGNRGCLEAYAGGWALLRDLQNSGIDVTSHDDLIQLINTGNPHALEAIRRAGRLIGGAIATAINLMNPEIVVIGGRLVNAGGDLLFAGIREMVYRRSLPLATSSLRIEQSTLYPTGGMVGLSALVVDAITSPTHIGQLL
ncbi:ROK family protein [Microbacterium sp. YY-01]|uniref:ROK family transcriptional regulator n=1 Tax=Microbacterium sp. YY-01 TaxID=3421634 RepID=UPI003D184093